MIKVLIGNLFESKAKALVNTVNCVGVMGKGVALEFKKRYPDMMKDYKNRCDSKLVKPGQPYLYDDLFDTKIINFPTKDHWRSASKLEDVVNGLDIFVNNYKAWGISSIAFPPLGCGNGGLSWQLVGPIMYQKLAPLALDVEIYAPFGTALEYLKTDFLLEASVSSINVKGVVQQKLKKEWIAPLEVLNRLSQNQFVAHIGRTIFQKICYVLTEQGVETGFRFKQGSYGPFSDDVKSALMVYSNTNLIQEKNQGPMTRMFVGPEYKEYQERYAGYLKQIENKINKTVDLFSRIKDSCQAEEVATVFYAVRQLKKNNEIVSEQDVFEFICQWKKEWSSREKKATIASAIRNLVMLRWISVTFSTDFIDEEALLA